MPKQEKKYTLVQAMGMCDLSAPTFQRKRKELKINADNYGLFTLTDVEKIKNYKPKKGRPLTVYE